MKNCRNCKWAEWAKTATGRRTYNFAAYCTFPVVVVLPASRRREEGIFSHRVGVAEYGNEPVDCKVWEKEK